MLEVYAFSTPNRAKVPIALEELDAADMLEKGDLVVAARVIEEGRALPPACYASMWKRKKLVASRRHGSGKKQATAARSALIAPTFLVL